MLCSLKSLLYVFCFVDCQVVCVAALFINVPSLTPMSDFYSSYRH